MAIVNAGFLLTITLGAKNDATRTVNYELTAADYAAAVTQYTAISALLLAVSAGAIRGYNILARAVEDAYVRPTSDEAESRDTARITAYNANNPFKKVNFGIPMPKLAIFKATAGELMDEVDIADADLIAYKNIWDETTGYAKISDGEYIGNLLRGKRAS